jgi:hypothetical protein
MLRPELNSPPPFERETDVHDLLPHLFPPETPLPNQYPSRSAHDTADAPEKRLMLAVLLDAIIQLRNGDSSDLIDAENWIRDHDASDEPFSFSNICAVLDIESSYLRRGLLAWRDRPADTARRPPIRHIRIWQATIAPRPRAEQRPR